MTARLATHPEVAARTADVLERLIAADVDVELHGSDREARRPDPLQALRDGATDLALVGVAALRGSAADDLTTVAVLPRENARDVLVALAGAPRPLAELPPDACVGVQGARRLAFLRAHRPDVEAIVLEAGSAPLAARDDLDAVVIGVVEARSAGLVDRIAEVLEPKSWLPEPGSGALALVALHPIAEATALDHLPTRTALRAELALLDALELDERTALGSLAQPSGRWIRLWAAAVSEDGARMVRSDLTGPLDEPEALGAAVARQLSTRGIDLVAAGAP